MQAEVTPTITLEVSPTKISQDTDTNVSINITSDQTISRVTITGNDTILTNKNVYGLSYSNIFVINPGSSSSYEIEAEIVIGSKVYKRTATIKTIEPDFTYNISPAGVMPLIANETNNRTLTISSEYVIKYLTLEIIG
jgi:predicted nuclease of restriction endonuclease-like RecB superfamily